MFRKKNLKEFFEEIKEDFLEKYEKKLLQECHKTNLKESTKDVRQKSMKNALDEFPKKKASGAEFPDEISGRMPK